MNSKVLVELISLFLAGLRLIPQHLGQFLKLFGLDLRFKTSNNRVEENGNNSLNSKNGNHQRTRTTIISMFVKKNTLPGTQI